MKENSLLQKSGEGQTNELFELITVLHKNEERTEEPEPVKIFVKCMGE